MQKILVVERSDSMRAAICCALQGAGYAFTGVSTGEFALAAIESDEIVFNLVVTCQNLAWKIKGVDLVVVLRANERYECIPILMHTTETSQQMQDAFRAAKVTCYLPKPFDAEQFLRVVARMLPC